MGLFFKSKAQKKQEAMDKDVDRMMSVCTCRNALDIRVDILAALPAFYVRNVENLSVIKDGRYCTIDAIIFSTYVACEQTLHGEAYKFSNFVESSIKKKVKENLIVILSTYYGISQNEAQIMVENRYEHYDYTIKTFGGNPGENLDAISEAFSYISAQTAHEGKYLPFTPDSPIYVDDLFENLRREAEIHSLVAGIIAYAGTLFTEERRKLDMFK